MIFMILLGALAEHSDGEIDPKEAGKRSTPLNEAEKRRGRGRKGRKRRMRAGLEESNPDNMSGDSFSSGDIQNK